MSGCERNARPADEDCGRVRYRPCGKTPTFECTEPSSIGAGSTYDFCAEHAEEAEREGLTVQREEPTGDAPL